jgi:hypothetical protein
VTERYSWNARREMLDASLNGIEAAGSEKRGVLAVL